MNIGITTTRAMVRHIATPINRRMPRRSDVASLPQMRREVSYCCSGSRVGLVPCSAAVAVLALCCLQVNEILLGIALVLCCSAGMAMTLTAAGMTAAVATHHVSRRWSGFGALAPRALSLRLGHDGRRALCRLAGLGERRRHALTEFLHALKEGGRGRPMLRPSPGSTAD
jgi:hypothetical protein